MLHATHPLMLVIICAKYIKNRSRTVDATEQTPFSNSRPNDLEDIGQGQGSSHATHPLMLLIICTKYGKNPSWTVDATGRTRKVNGQTDRQTDRRTDRQTRWIQYTPPNFVAGGIKTCLTRWSALCPLMIRHYYVFSYEQTLRKELYINTRLPHEGFHIIDIYEIPEPISYSLFLSQRNNS